uniref:Uncharacterized protein n=1 Tax=Anguilla anguilla TaxID=7936 RepID=A0A0E9UYL4_ANGAN
MRIRFRMVSTYQE